MEIFILSGQSNMSGRGGVVEVVADDGSAHKKWDGKLPAECAAEPGSILRLSHSLDWEEAHEPLHADIDSGEFRLLHRPCLSLVSHNVLSSNPENFRKIARKWAPCTQFGCKLIANWFDFGFEFGLNLVSDWLQMRCKLISHYKLASLRLRARFEFGVNLGEIRVWLRIRR